MTTSQSPPQPVLSFPRETFAKLSPHPYLLAHLQPSSPTHPSLRANGRSPSQFRPPHMNTSSLTHCSGSAVVRIGDTAVVCGIRAEILHARDVPHLRITKSIMPLASTTTAGRANIFGGGIGTRTPWKKDAGFDIKELDLLVPNIELATGCSPQFLPGLGPPSQLAQSLSTRIREGFYSTGVVHSDALGIWYTPPQVLSGTNGGDVDEEMKDSNGQNAEDEEGEEEQKSEIKAFWTLYIDVLFISLDGNPFDAAWAAVMAALHDVELPRAYWDAEREMVLCSDESKDTKKLSLMGLPVAVTAVVFKAKEREERDKKHRKYWILADPDSFEEGLCDESVTVVVDCSEFKSKVLGISKRGGTIVGPEEIRAVTVLAEKRWMEVGRVIMGYIGGI